MSYNNIGAYKKDFKKIFLDAMREVGFNSDLREIEPCRNTLTKGKGMSYYNETFSIMPYYWSGECTCGNLKYPHKSTCLKVEPNFLFKPNGYTIYWYKYVFKKAMANREVSVEQFREMLDICVESCKTKGVTKWN